MNNIYFITGNKGKVGEAKQKFSNLNIDIIQKDLGYPEIQADSLEEVALFGANHVQKIFDKPFILEDAGLFIDSLKGFPGVYSAYVYYKIGLVGILKLLDSKKDRNATFRSVYAFGKSGSKPMLFTGECKGKISNEEKGTHGFGYDPIFIPQGESITFAQMQTNQKNLISHRGDSLNKLIDFFKNMKIENIKNL
jgi:XTP/dITP diphosphohydrolase